MTESTTSVTVWFELGNKTAYNIYLATFSETTTWVGFGSYLHHHLHTTLLLHPDTVGVPVSSLSLSSLRLSNGFHRSQRLLRTLWPCSRSWTRSSRPINQTQRTMACLWEEKQSMATLPKSPNQVRSNRWALCWTDNKAAGMRWSDVNVHFQFCLWNLKPTDS